MISAKRRSEAARWLRKTVGVVIGKDLPEQPSEEEFRLGLRNGIILCNAFNKVFPSWVVSQPLVIQVIEAPPDSAVLPDGAPLTAFQYFENVRNFLVALEDKGLPTFEASDLLSDYEFLILGNVTSLNMLLSISLQGGKGSRVIDSVLALQSFSECKQIGKNGSAKYGGILKPVGSGKSFFKKNTEAFMNSLQRSQSLNDKPEHGQFLDRSFSEDLSNYTTEMKPSESLNVLVRSVLIDKKSEEVPFIVEALLNRVVQEFENRIASQTEMVKATMDDRFPSSISLPELDTESLAETKVNAIAVDRLPSSQSLPAFDTESLTETRMKVNNDSYKMIEDHPPNLIVIDDELVKEKIQKRQLIFARQQRELEELKHTHRTAKADLELLKSWYSEEFNNLGKQLQFLSSAAEGYHKVLQENRKLYNQVQDLKGNIRVYCRVRPLGPGQLSGATPISRVDDGSITITTPSKYGKEGRRSFNFNKVFGPSASQEKVFADTQPLIRSVLDGYNICIFAYGQTGSGKTYTMSGPNKLNEQSIGVNYRALNDLFQLSEQRKGTFSYEISVQMIEIYNEQVRDLLDGDGGNKRLEIRNSSQKGLNVPDANVVRVACPTDVIELMNLGQRNRAVSATAMNDRSSRSHSCLTIHVNGKDLTSGTMLRGSMHLVDLAGSERVDKSEVKGDRLKEAQHINKSLSALGDVIASLAQKNSHVPYRNSKLTQLLQDSLGGQAKTLMFVHIAPEMDAVGETLSTLKFAERVATVELGAAKSNKESGEVKELKEQIANLKAALARKEAESEPLRSTMSSPDLFRTKSSGAASSDGETVARDVSSQKQKKHNFDIQELIGDDREMGSGDDESLKDDFFCPRYTPDMRKEILELDVNGSRFDSDSDDSEMATSNSSEMDLHYQFSLPKNIPASGGRSKLKKPGPKAAKSQVTRSTSHPHIPSPVRKVSNGSAHTSNRMARPASAGNAGMKRSASSGKVVNGK